MKYIDRNGKDAVFYCSGAQYVERKPLKTVFSELPETEFAYINSGQIVNFMRIAEFNKDEVKLDSGAVLLEKLSFPAMLPLALCVVYFQRVYKRLIAERLVISWMALFFAAAVIFALRTLQKEQERDKMLHLRFQMLEDN